MRLLLALGVTLLNLINVECSYSSKWVRESNLLSESSLANQVHRITVALKQSQPDKIMAYAQQVSDITSDIYGSYLSLSELSKWSSAPSESIEAVTNFFIKNGALNVDSVLTKDFLIVDMPIAALSSAFGNIPFHSLRHSSSGRIIHRAPLGSWSMPEEIAPHVQLISGLSDLFESPKEIKEFATHVRRAKEVEVCPASSAQDFGRIRTSENAIIIPITIRCLDGNTTSNLASPCSETGNAANPFSFKITANGHDDIVHDYFLNDLTCGLSASKAVTCTTPRINVPAYARLNISVTATYGYPNNIVHSEPAYMPMLVSTSPLVTPDLIFKQYNVPLGLRGTNSKNSIGVPGFELQYVSNADIKAFHEYMGLEYNPATIIGQNDESNPGGESSLDIQYIMGTAPGVPATFQSVTGTGPAIPPGQGAYILEWAYTVSNNTNPPWVTSISYGDTEDGFFNKFGDFSYIDRMNVELAKMATRGLTVLAGSGDAGASNVGEAGNDVSPEDPSCTPFRPFFPSNSPYVTSVSSTFFTKNHLPICSSNLATMPIECSNLGERATSVSDGMFWTTGGGFSNMTTNPTPSWQKSFVANYLKRQTDAGTLPPLNVFNANGRGYPDIATVGHNLLMVLGGTIVTVDGTSASGPIMAGLVALLNDARFNAGQAPMGLMNSFLYSAKTTRPDAFRDVVTGSNNDGDVQARCSQYSTFCPYGFKTASGWSPVTGLGTPNWSILRDIALNTKTLSEQLRQRVHDTL